MKNKSDNFCDDGNVVAVSANNIDDGLNEAGFPSTRLGVMFDKLVDVDRINDGNDIVVCTVDINYEVNIVGFPRTRCGNTVFLVVNDTIRCSFDLPS